MLLLVNEIHNYKKNLNPYLNPKSEEYNKYDINVNASHFCEYVFSQQCDKKVKDISV